MGMKTYVRGVATAPYDTRTYTSGFNAMWVETSAALALEGVTSITVDQVQYVHADSVLLMFVTYPSA